MRIKAAAFHFYPTALSRGIGTAMNRDGFPYGFAPGFGLIAASKTSAGFSRCDVALNPDCGKTAITSNDPVSAIKDINHSP
jgi:hypothetical protein